MKKILYGVALYALVLFIPISSDAQWVQQTNPSGKALHSVYFVNSTTGFSCGDTGTVLKSINGGLAWSNINTGIPGNINMTDIQFLDNNTGYCAGGIGSLSSKVFKSINGGSSWTEVFDTTGTGFRTLFFIDVNTGWVVGADGVVKYTSNGGNAWSSRNVNISSLTDVYALSADTVFVSGFGSGGSIVKSTNGGINWTFTSVPGDFADFKFVTFANSNTGYAGGLKFGGGGVMGKTTDKGLTWSVLSTYSGPTPYDAVAISNDVVFFVRTDDTVSVTIDGGNAWSREPAETDGFDKSISVKDGLGVVAGRQFAVNTTVGIQQISSEVPENYTLNQNYPNPFNPVTNIIFNLPERRDVKLTVYNSLGMEVMTLVNEVRAPGTYRVDFDGSKFSSGVYFYRLETEDFMETKKMLLVK